MLLNCSLVGKEIYLFCFNSGFESVGRSCPRKKEVVIPGTIKKKKGRRDKRWSRGRFAIEAHLPPKAARRVKAATAKATKAKQAAAPKKAAAGPMKTAAPKAKSPVAKLAAGESHPPYLEMIVAAVESLKEHNGSSRQAILQYITSTYELAVDSKMAKLKLKEALRRGVKTGILKKTKVRNCLLFSFSCVSY